MKTLSRIGLAIFVLLTPALAVAQQLTREQIVAALDFFSRKLKGVPANIKFG